LGDAARRRAGRTRGKAEGEQDDSEPRSRHGCLRSFFVRELNPERTPGGT
jgi:hypothetical protein